MAGRFGNALNLMSSCWEVLRNDTKLLLFPMISGICIVLVTLSFAASYVFAPAFWQELMHKTSLQGPFDSQHIIAYLILFAFYFCSYSVMTFFNAGLVACAIRNMRNQPATFANGISEAMARLPQIALWALIQASVGLLLRAIENRSKLVGSIIAGVIGIAFSIASFFVIPIIIAENKSPFAAFSQSSNMFKKTWGERIVGNVGWSLMFFLLFLPILALTMFGIAMHSIPALVIAVLGFYMLMLTFSTLQSIFHAALYLYCQNGETPKGFDGNVMGTAFIAKGGK